MSNRKVVVMEGIAALRQNPYKDSELADEALYGMELEVLEEYGQWLHVETSYHYKGYIHAANTTEIGNWAELDKKMIIASFADIQLHPKYSANRITSIPRGASIALTGEKQDKWLQVMLPTKEIGWIREEAVSTYLTREGSDLRHHIISAALLYLGTQYRWGGKTPMGIDCSGLSSMAYMLNGIILPRDSGDQMNFMRKIHRQESKPGDLLFFPGHVAVYIGEDKFVHATGSDGLVKINSLNKDSKLYRKDLDEKYICTGTVF